MSVSRRVVQDKNAFLVHFQVSKSKTKKFFSFLIKTGAKLMHDLLFGSISFLADKATELIFI